MVELTREETIKVLDCCDSNEHNCETSCPLFPGTDAKCAQTIAQNVLRYFLNKKEKEPAPAATGTSSEVKTLHIDDITETVICQAISYVNDAIQTILEMYEEMSCEEQKAFDLGETYKNMLCAKKELEQLKFEEDNNAHRKHT